MSFINELEEFFSTAKPPENLDDTAKIVRQFITRHNEAGRCVVLVTVSAFKFNACVVRQRKRLNGMMHKVLAVVIADKRLMENYLLDAFLFIV